MSEAWRAFDSAWFARQQARLLWLLRFRAVRELLGIEAREAIVRILPHAFEVALAGELRRIELHTHQVYAKRIYRALAPLWWALHAWDALVADRCAPRLSFGFATLTQWPDPGHDLGVPAYTTVSGTAIRNSGVGEAWATIRVGTGGATSSVNAQGLDLFSFTCHGSTTDNYTALVRAFLSFDTSPLARGDLVSAVLSVYSTGVRNNLSLTSPEPNANVYGWTQQGASNTIVNADFQNAGSTAFCNTPLAYSSVIDNAYNDFALNAAGLANIVQTGITRFSMRNANYDVAAVKPGWVASALTNIAMRSSYTFISLGFHSVDPKLVVTYIAAPKLKRDGTRPRGFAPGLAR